MAPLPSPSPAFLHKKSSILSSLATSTDPTTYTDKSPKGSVDVEIIDLIDEINGCEGWVTTSSCAGRVAVFVEGRKRGGNERRDEGGEGDGEGNGYAENEVTDNMGNGEKEQDTVNGTSKPTANISKSTSTGAGPGGKGYGNKWLYVSHEPVPPISALSTSSSSKSTITESTSTSTSTSTSNTTPAPPSASITTYHGLFNLTPPPPHSPSPSSPLFSSHAPPRLIKLIFSPLILHILCSSLHTAKPLLAAAINAGFRESGVQSLKILEQDATDMDKGGGGSGGEKGGVPGVMLAIRTAGVSFESVIGYVEEGGGEKGEVYRSMVSEEWLVVLVGICSGRFVENVARRERLRSEIRGIRKRSGSGGENGKEGENGVGQEWEDKDERRRRKREEGLRVKKERELGRGMETERQQNDGGVRGGGIAEDGEQDDGLDEGLFLGDT